MNTEEMRDFARIFVDDSAVEIGEEEEEEEEEDLQGKQMFRLI